MNIKSQNLFREGMLLCQMFCAPDALLPTGISHSQIMGPGTAASKSLGIPSLLSVLLRVSLGGLDASSSARISTPAPDLTAAISGDYIRLKVEGATVR